jgi:trk system potassium uptake protein
MNVLIAGGGRTATHLATLLLAQNHEVRLIENRKEILTRMHRDLPTEIIYEGYPTIPETLQTAGILEADVVTACSTSDTENLVFCYLARNNFNVQRTIARINDPRNTWLFDQKFHVDVPLNHVGIMASLIEEEMSFGDMMTLLKLRRGLYSLVEEKIPPGAKAVGTAIKDLGLPEQCVIAAIIRGGKIIVPRGITRLEIGDEILAVTDFEGAKQFSLLFTPIENEEEV